MSLLQQELFFHDGDDGAYVINVSKLKQCIMDNSSIYSYGVVNLTDATIQHISDHGIEFDHLDSISAEELDIPVVGIQREDS